MHVADTIAAPHGHWMLQVYDGDVERAPLSPEDERENELFASLYPTCPYPLHAGRIVSRPIDTYEGDNLVVTAGKGLYLDRLYALGAAVALTHMGVGATATAAVVGDVQLGSTPTLKVFDALPSRAGLVTTALTTFATGEANISWNELAQFNGPTNGTSTMYNRVAPIGPFVKSSAVAIGATVTITQG